MVEFRINAKKFFLTYPQCEVSIEDAWIAIRQVGITKNCCIAQEEHANGGKHLHILVEFVDTLRTRRTAVFDIDNHHPNIQVPRNWKATLTYCKKDGVYRVWKDEQPVPEDVLAEDSDDEEFDLFRSARTMEYEDYFRKCLKKKIPHQYAMTGWNQRDSMFTINDSDEIEGFVREDLEELQTFEFHSQKCIVIIGPTGIGKTTIAKKIAKKPALIISHMDSLRKLRPDHKSIIFDDMSFEHLPRESQLHIVDRYVPRAIHCRHVVAEIPAGIQKIFTANSRPFIEDPAVERRLEVFKYRQIVYLE